MKKFINKKSIDKNRMNFKKKLFNRFKSIKNAEIKFIEKQNTINDMEVIKKLK